MYGNSKTGNTNELVTASIPFYSFPFESSRSTPALNPFSASDWLEPHAQEPAGGQTAGQQIGPYRLLERLGRGGQADVWRALRLEPTVMEVALKLIPKQGQDPRRIAQLRREAERGVRLAGAGPGLVRAFAFGETDDLWFMAMPLVIGTTLGAILAQRRDYVLERGPFDNAHHKLATLPEPQYTRDIIELMGGVARSLAYAHAAQVVHRDVKPLNILVPRNHREGAYLCDFGLGRDLDIATPDQLLDGAGSPFYMAPERLLKLAADEYRCEVFAIGATLFEALTLALPFGYGSNLDTDERLRLLTTSEPLRPSQLRPDLDPRIEAVLLKAVARDPAGRHATAASLASDLERLLPILENKKRADAEKTSTLNRSRSGYRHPERCFRTRLEEPGA